MGALLAGWHPPCLPVASRALHHRSPTACMHTCKHSKEGSRSWFAVVRPTCPRPAGRPLWPCHPAVLGPGPCRHDRLLCTEHTFSYTARCAWPSYPDGSTGIQLTACTGICGCLSQASSHLGIRACGSADSTGLPHSMSESSCSMQLHLFTLLQELW